MYAVVRTGGKQYKVEEGTVLDVEQLPGEKGDSVELDEVLLIADGEKTNVGQPLLDGAKVNCKIVSQKKGPKVVIFKKIRRQDKQLTKGHRQLLTRLQVENISA